MALEPVTIIAATPAEPGYRIARQGGEDMNEETRYALYFIRENGMPEPMLTTHSIERGYPDGTSRPNKAEAKRTFAQYVDPFERGEFEGIVEIALYEEPAGNMLASTSAES